MEDRYRYVETDKERQAIARRFQAWLDTKTRLGHCENGADCNRFTVVGLLGRGWLCKDCFYRAIP